LPCGRFAHTANDAVGIRACGSAQLFDRLRHRAHGMLPQQLQHTHELSHSGTGTVPVFQPCSQFAKRGREFPIPVDDRVI